MSYYYTSEWRRNKDAENNKIISAITFWSALVGFLVGFWITSRVDFINFIAPLVH